MLVSSRNRTSPRVRPVVFAGFFLKCLLRDGYFRRFNLLPKYGPSPSLSSCRRFSQPTSFLLYSLGSRTGRWAFHMIELHQITPHTLHPPSGEGMQSPGLSTQSVSKPFHYGSRAFPPLFITIRRDFFPPPLRCSGLVFFYRFKVLTTRSRPIISVGPFDL